MLGNLQWQAGLAITTHDGVAASITCRKYRLQRQRTNELLLIWIVCCFHLWTSVNAWQVGKPHQPVSRRSTLFKSAAALSVFLARPSTARNLPEQYLTIDYSKTGSVEALIPIVQFRDNLQDLETKLKTEGKAAVSRLNQAVGRFPRNEQAFKALFDAYSDPVTYKQKFVDQNAFLVYYTQGFDGPDRPSIESELPVRQTIQYGARNDAWVAWQDFETEVTYAQTHPADSTIEDLAQLLDKVIVAVEVYLGQAPVEDVKEARKKLEQ